MKSFRRKHFFCTIRWKIFEIWSDKSLFLNISMRKQYVRLFFFSFLRRWKCLSVLEVFWMKFVEASIIVKAWKTWNWWEIFKYWVFRIRSEEILPKHVRKLFHRTIFHSQVHSTGWGWMRGGGKPHWRIKIELHPSTNEKLLIKNGNNYILRIVETDLYPTPNHWRLIASTNV